MSEQVIEQVTNDPRINVNWDDIPLTSQERVATLAHLVITSISALVNNPEDTKIVVRANHKRVMFTVRPLASDVAFALGKGGAHANALRVLLIAASRKLDFHFDMDIIGPSGSADWSSD